MLLSILPAAIVLPAVRPREHAMALLFVVDILSVILTAVGPCENTRPIHLIMLPLAVVLAPVRPGVDAVAVDVVFEELARVSAPVSPQELTSTMLLAVAVLALVAGVVRPYLLTVTMLLVLVPVALVPRPVRVVILAKAVRLIVLPLAIIDIAVRMDKPTTAIGLVCLPIALVKRSIHPDLNTSPVFPAHVVPLSLVLSAVVESDQRSRHADLTVGRRARLEIERLERVSDLHDELSRLQDLLIGSCVGGHGERGVFSLEAILGLDGAARDKPSEVALHRHRSILFNIFRVEVLCLASYSLRLLGIKFGLIGFGPAACLSHFFQGLIEFVR